MSDDKSFDEFYAKLNDIVNFAYNLGEIYDQPKIVKNILRSLTENFRLKVTAITIKCNATPRDKREKKKNTKTKEQRTMVTKGKTMKHKDHVRKTQLV